MKGDIEALLAPLPVRFTAAEHPALHPGRSAAVEVDGEAVGYIGELHPKWRQSYELPHAPIVFELDAAALLKRALPRFQSIPKQQSAWRDISVIAGEQVTHESLVETIAGVDPSLVRSAKLFDIYKPATPVGDMAPGERSLAIRLELLDDSATLTDERIEAGVRGVLDTLKARLGVRLRG